MDANNVYDPTGHLQREVDSGSRTHSFGYNNRYELVSESHPDFGTILYSIDLNGNRTSKSVNGVVDYYGIGADNRLAWVNRGTNDVPVSGQAAAYTLFSYDANGNMVERERKYDSGLLRVY